MSDALTFQFVRFAVVVTLAIGFGLIAIAGGA